MRRPKRSACAAKAVYTIQIIITVTMPIGIVTEGKKRTQSGNKRQSTNHASIEAKNLRQALYLPD